MSPKIVACCPKHPTIPLKSREDRLKLYCPACEPEKENLDDLLGTDVALPADPKEMPKPTCGKCGGEVPFFYFYVYKLQSTQGTMVFQASCCPHAGCRALFIVLPIGLESSGVAAPGKPGWPGMPS